MKAPSILQLSMFILLVSDSCVQAQIIFDNSGAASGFGFVHSGQWYAQSFVVGGSDHTFSSVVLNMDNAINSNGEFFVSIYDAAGANGRPGNSLLTLSGSANPSVAGDYAYTGSVGLSASTAYWVVAGVGSGSGAYRWNLQSPESVEVGTAFGISQNNGAGWQAPSAGTAFLIEVSGAVVPEPSQWATVALLLCAGGAVLRHRRRQNTR
jgi:hypothetical protein